MVGLMPASQPKRQDRTPGPAETSQWWILSDVHYIAPSLHDQGPAFQKIADSVGDRDLVYQEESIQAFVDKALTQRPTGLIITGDLTINGAYDSMKGFADKLRPLRQAGIQILVIPGNHDINNGWARGFKGENQIRVKETTPADFAQLFPDGYGQGDRDPASLSYALDVGARYTFIFLDGNRYANQPSDQPPPSKGTLKEETLAWLKDQLRKVKAEGKEAILFAHHNLYFHNNVVSEGFAFTNAMEVRDLLAGYPVPLVFSGHMHIQDILQPNPKQPTEILNGSYGTLDLNYGVLDLANQMMDYHKDQVDMSAWAKAQGLTDPILLNFEDYLKDRFLKQSRQIYLKRFDEGKDQATSIQAVATFLADLRMKNFLGEDNYTPEEIAAIKAREEYRFLENLSPFQSHYLAALMGDASPDLAWHLDLPAATGPSKESRVNH